MGFDEICFWVKGWVEFWIISLKISSISFWKTINSPLRTRLDGANSINILLNAVDVKDVLALSLLSLYYCKNRTSMFFPYIKGLSSIVWVLFCGRAPEDCLLLSLAPFFLIYYLSILACLYTLFILMNILLESIKLSFPLTRKLYRCSKKNGLHLDLLSRLSRHLQGSLTYLTNFGRLSLSVRHELVFLRSRMKHGSTKTHDWGS